VIQAFVFFLLCVAPHPVLGLLTGPCPVACAGRNHYIWWISSAQGLALLDQSSLPCVSSHGGLSAVLCLTLGCDCSVEVVFEDWCFRRRTSFYRNGNHWGDGDWLPGRRQHVTGRPWL